LVLSILFISQAHGPHRETTKVPAVKPKDSSAGVGLRLDGDVDPKDKPVNWAFDPKEKLAVPLVTEVAVPKTRTKVAALDQQKEKLAIAVVTEPAAADPNDKLAAVTEVAGVADTKEMLAVVALSIFV